MESFSEWSQANLGQWHYVLGYAITLTSHNWPILLALAMSIWAGVRLYRRPSRRRTCWLYSWLLIGLSYEYHKHVAEELHAAIDFLAIGALSAPNAGLHLLVEPGITALLLGAALGFGARAAWQGRHDAATLAEGDVSATAGRMTSGARPTSGEE